MWKQETYPSDAEEKEMLRRRDALGDFIKPLINIEISCDPSTVRKIILVAMFISVIVIWETITTAQDQGVAVFAPAWEKALKKFALTVLLIAVVTGVLHCMGAPLCGRGIRQRLRRAGIMNSINSAPRLLYKYKDKDNNDLEILVFDNAGIALDVWETERAKLQIALRRSIVSISEHDKRYDTHILCY